MFVIYFKPLPTLVDILHHPQLNIAFNYYSTTVANSLMTRINVLCIEQKIKMRYNILEATFFTPCPHMVLKLSDSSDHQAKPNPKPPLGPLGLRGREGPERVRAHTNDGGNHVQSAGA